METLLPHTRIRTIMKSSLDTGQITNEVLYLITKSTEMFIKHLSRGAYDNPIIKQTSLKYEQLASFVQATNRLEFLLQVLPQKMSVKDVRAVLANLNDDSESSSEDEN